MDIVWFSKVYVRSISFREYREMEFARITSDKRMAGKAVWLIYTFCSFMMEAMAYVNGWAWWITAVLAVHLVVLTFLTFYPKSSVNLQSTLMMLFSFGNVFMCSIAERNIYQSMPVLLGATIILVVYRNEKLLAGFSLLTLGEILIHIFALRTVEFGTSLDVIEFIVRVSVIFAAQLFVIIVVRGLNLNRERMLKSVEEARQAERYKSDFLANMSHEIRTPMNAIIGMCELILRENSLSSSVRENCFNIQASGKSLLSIINDILDFSKIESGKMELIEAEFNIASMLNDVINMSEARRKGKNLEILVDVDPNIPKGLIGDEVRIRQVIVNLMTNAIKFTEKGSVTLTVDHGVQDYGVNLIVTVTDTGIGITEENIEKLFTSFRQVDTRKNRSVEGTGLGLAICKRLVKQMGGFIGVKSKYGVGSEFRFVIPLKVSDASPFATVKEPEKIYAAACFGENMSGDMHRQILSATSRKLGVGFKFAKTTEKLKALFETEKFTHIFVSGKEYLKDSDFFVSAAKDARIFVIQDRVDSLFLPEGIKPIYKPFYVIPAVSALNNENMVLNLNERRGADIGFTAPRARVLIVDDNAINLKVVTGLMQPYNMQVMTAESGPGAIKMLRSRDIDLVFMDHMMAEMDGVEATEIIRNMGDDYYKKLPIIALTANAVNGAREMYINAGLNDFLAKPIELSALDRILRSYLPKEYMQPPTRSFYAKGDRRRSARPAGNHSNLLDVDKGIAYTGGNVEAYREILMLYFQKSAEKIKRIAELYERGDLNNYIIEVHALKSTSLSVGAVQLYELAKEIEAAGKEGSFAPEKKNDDLLRLYREVASAIGQYLGIAEGSSPRAMNAESARLSELSADVLRRYIRRAKAACRGFDGKLVADIAAEIEPYSFGGEALRDYFGPAAHLAEDFEYEAAENELEKLEEKLQSLH